MASNYAKNCENWRMYFKDVAFECQLLALLFRVFEVIAIWHHLSYKFIQYGVKNRRIQKKHILKCTKNHAYFTEVFQM